jgi:hypothetical protein
MSDEFQPFTGQAYRVGEAPAASSPGAPVEIEVVQVDSQNDSQETILDDIEGWARQQFENDMTAHVAWTKQLMETVSTWELRQGRYLENAQLVILKDMASKFQTELEDLIVFDMPASAFDDIRVTMTSQKTSIDEKYKELGALMGVRKRAPEESTDQAEKKNRSTH